MDRVIIPVAALAAALAFASCGRVTELPSRPAIVGDRPSSGAGFQAGLTTLSGKRSFCGATSVSRHVAVTVVHCVNGRET